MPINQAFLGEFDHEMANTRKTLERVPLDKFDWAPHAKSMAMGSLANHLTDMPGWIKDTLEKDSHRHGSLRSGTSGKNHRRIARALR